MRQEKSHVYLRKRAFVFVNLIDIGAGTVGLWQVCR